MDIANTLREQVAGAPEQLEIALLLGGEFDVRCTGDVRRALYEQLRDLDEGAAS